MANKIKIFITSCLMIIFSASFLNCGYLDAAYGVDICENLSGVDARAREAAGCNDKALSEETIVQRVLTFMYWIVGIVAVIMVIIGGFMYVTSGGDPAKIKTAKDTLLVAIVGLFIAILAAIIINFVTGNLLDN